MAAEDAASLTLNLPDHRVTAAVQLPDGARHVTVESIFPPGCTSCGVIAPRVKERRTRSSPRGAVSETAVAFGFSWWLVQQVIGQAALRLPDVDLLAPRMLGIDEHRYRSVRFFQDPGTKAWTRYEPWRTTIVDLDTGQVLGIEDGRDHEGVGDWLFARPLQWRLGVQVVAIDPSAAFRKALRMWLPRSAVSVDLFHVTLLANDMLTTVCQGLSQQARGRRGRATDPAWANRAAAESR